MEGDIMIKHSVAVERFGPEADAPAFLAVTCDCGWIADVPHINTARSIEIAYDRTDELVNEHKGTAT
jgi:hypothetical protein